MSGQKTLYLCKWRFKNRLNTWFFHIFQLAVGSRGLVLGDSRECARHCHNKCIQFADCSPYKATYFLEPFLYWQLIFNMLERPNNVVFIPKKMQFHPLKLSHNVILCFRTLLQMYFWWCALTTWELIRILKQPWWCLSFCLYFRESQITKA